MCRSISIMWIMMNNITNACKLLALRYLYSYFLKDDDELPFMPVQSSRYIEFSILYMPIMHAHKQVPNL